MNKRGQSHIEFIISFALFTTFVVLILFLFKPSFKSSEIGLNAIENSIMDNVNTNLSFYSVKIPQVTQSCFCLNNDIGINFIVKDENKSIIDSFDAGGICVNKRDIASTTNFYYVYIYFSDEFGEPSKDGAGCLSLQDTDVEKGPLRELSVVSNNSLYALNGRYYSSYAGLRQELGVTNYDFGVKVIDDTGNIIIDMSRRVPLGRPVYSKDVPIEIIYKDGSSTYDIMRISAW
jgi:hypothetical protein